MPNHIVHSAILRDSIDLGDQVFARMDNEGTLELFISDGKDCYSQIYLDAPVLDKLVKILQKAGYC